MVPGSFIDKPIWNNESLYTNICCDTALQKAFLNELPFADLGCHEHSYSALCIECKNTNNELSDKTWPDIQDQVELIPQPKNNYIPRAK